MASSTRGSRGVVACTSIYRGRSSDSACGGVAVAEGTSDWVAWSTTDQGEKKKKEVWSGQAEKTYGHKVSKTAEGESWMEVR